MVRLAGTVEAAAVLLLHGGRAERRQALRGQHASLVRVHEDAGTWQLAVTDDGDGFDLVRAGSRPGRDWPTCVTGWTPSAES